MITSSLRNGLLLLISGLLMGGFGCQSSHKNPTPDAVVEMPKPGSVHTLDSLKNIQQQKRDSLRRNR